MIGYYVEKQPMPNTLTLFCCGGASLHVGYWNDQTGRIVGNVQTEQTEMW